MHGNVIYASSTVEAFKAKATSSRPRLDIPKAKANKFGLKTKAKD